MALFDSSHVIDGLEAADQDAVFEALAQKAVELGVTSDASAVIADAPAAFLASFALNQAVQFCRAIVATSSIPKLNFSPQIELQEKHTMARETFQTRLKRAMESAGLKQVDLVRIAAERGAKLGKSQVSQYVSGKVTPRRDVMELLAGVLGVTPQWLMGAADAMPDDVAPADVAPEAAAPQAPSTSRQKKTDQGSVTMREFKKSNKLDNVLYDVRGPVVDEAARMEEDGARILKLNIGNPAPFGFRAPDEVVYDMRQQLTDCEGYSDSRGLFAARKAIMQYAQLRNIPNVDMKHIYTGNGVSELIQLSMHALVGAYRPEGYEWLDELTQVLGANVDWACDYITEHFDGVSVQKPQGTYMLFVDCSEWCAAHGRDIDWVERACWRVGVAVQDGRMFHGPCHLRMNLALPLDRVQEAFDRMDRYVFNA